MLWFKLVYSYANKTLFCLKDGCPPSRAMFLSKTLQHLGVSAALGLWEVAFRWHHKKWKKCSSCGLKESYFISFRDVIWDLNSGYCYLGKGGWWDRMSRMDMRQAVKCHLGNRSLFQTGWPPLLQGQSPGLCPATCWCSPPSTRTHLYLRNTSSFPAPLWVWLQGSWMTFPSALALPFRFIFFSL